MGGRNGRCKAVPVLAKQPLGSGEVKELQIPCFSVTLRISTYIYIILIFFFNLNFILNLTISI